jgi:hypothetical protein
MAISANMKMTAKVRMLSIVALKCAKINQISRRKRKSNPGYPATTPGSPLVAFWLGRLSGDTGHRGKRILRAGATVVIVGNSIRLASEVESGDALG